MLTAPDHQLSLLYIVSTDKGCFVPADPNLPKSKKRAYSKVNNKENKHRGGKKVS